MKLKTESEANKDTDVFVGMWRPPYPEVEARYKGCTIGRRPGSRELRDDYLRGDFDEPLYRCGLETPNDPRAVFHELAQSHRETASKCDNAKLPPEYGEYERGKADTYAVCSDTLKHIAKRPNDESSHPAGERKHD